MSTLTLDTKLKVTLGAKFATGDLADLYRCTYEQDGTSAIASHKDFWETVAAEDDLLDSTRTGLVKVARSAENNDLLEAESETLRQLFPDMAEDEKFYRYLPRLLGSGNMKGRQVNAFPLFEGVLSLETILEARPEGIDFRDFAWMFKRVLAGLGYVHQQGYVHGALLPSHILVHPMGHGAKIIDWSYAVPRRPKTSIKAFQSNWQSYYAPEVLAKQFPTEATDIYMLAKCAVALLGGDPATNMMPAAVPVDMQVFLGACLDPSPSKRAQDAWDLHEQFDELLKKLVGKPTYRAFSLVSA